MNHNASRLPTLDVEKALELLKPNGVLSRALKDFEPRDAQQKMMRNVLEAYNQDLIALIEAGTGTGKSMAYLIPALLWAVLRKERTLISTNTINLQEQLINKDIPLLTNSLNIDVKAVLVKGMSNYLCRRKHDEVQIEMRMLPLDEAQELEKINVWQQSTSDGSRSDLPFVPSMATWERVGAESDTCNRQECPFFEECYFFKARKKANDAQILVANHHMLFADLACRAEQDNYQDLAVLPAYNRIILDEAHNIEDIATDYFATRITRLGILRSLARLASEKQGKTQGKLPVLKEKIQEHFGRTPPREASNIFHRLNSDLPGLRNELQNVMENTFSAYDNFMKIFLSSGKNWDNSSPAGENKLRVLSAHKSHPNWEKEVVSHTNLLNGAIDRYVQGLYSLEVDLKAINNDKLQEQTKGIRFEISAMAERLCAAREGLAEFVANKDATDKVRWMESQIFKSGSNMHLINAELDVSAKLAKFLFQKFSTVVLCSATMTTNKQFEFIQKRLGATPELCPSRQVKENMYESPFNYKKQTLFAVPTDIPNPTDPIFTKAASEYIWQVIQISHGNAFVLFTSYSMLKMCYQLLQERLKQHRYFPLKQGDSNRQTLLEQFKSQNRSVLFGTDSFWEGVDVVGDALRCVIIVKLPFKVPSEPIIQARTEAISAKGGDPFHEYSLPNAIVKFKQGFGRLIRTKRDRGCIVCLDSRLLTKGYGKLFFNSLPDCQYVFAESAELQNQMKEFYRKTYYLTKS